MKELQKTRWFGRQATLYGIGQSIPIRRLAATEISTETAPVRGIAHGCLFCSIGAETACIKGIEQTGAHMRK